MEQRPQGCGVCPASTPSLRGSIFLYILNNKKHVSNVLINSSPEEFFFFRFSLKSIIWSNKSSQIKHAVHLTFLFSIFMGSARRPRSADGSERTQIESEVEPQRSNTNHAKGPASDGSYVSDVYIRVCVCVRVVDVAPLGNSCVYVLSRHA